MHITRTRSKNPNILKVNSSFHSSRETNGGWVKISVIFLFSYTYATDHNLIYTNTQNNVTISAHIITPQESADLFLHNLHAYQICPLQLSITNNSEKSLMISGNSIEELSLIPPHLITNDVIFKNHRAAAITAYACALTGWLALITGFSAIEQSLPKFIYTISHLSSAATLASFLYQAHRFVVHRSKQFTLTHARIMQYGLSSTNIIIDPQSSITLVMFLNNKSYTQPPTPTDMFYYLFNVKLYNVYNSTDIITLPVEVPKII